MKKRIFGTMILLVGIILIFGFAGCDPASLLGSTPGQVPSLTATAGDGQITVSWSAPSGSVTGYFVRCDETVITKTSSETTHTFTNLINGHTYTISVTAYNENGEGVPKSTTATPTGGSGGTGNVITTAWLDANNWTIGVPFQTSEYTVSTVISVPSNKTLTILPGTTISFTATNSGFNVPSGGNLKAVGLPVLLDEDEQQIMSGSNPVSGRIVFTSSKAAALKAPGDWDCISVAAANCEFKYCVFEYGGAYSSYGMLNVGNVKVTVENCDFKNSKYSGIRLGGGTASGFTSFINNTITNCGEEETGHYPIYLTTEVSLASLSGIGTGNNITTAKGVGVAWVNTGASANIKDLGVDYVFYGSGLYAMYGNYTLTIDPGVTIRFTHSGGGIEIKEGSTIKAIGTAEKPIKFIGGAQIGSWETIYLNSVKTDNEFAYCEFINGGSRTDNWNSPGVLLIYNSKVGITNSTITGGKVHGISLFDDYELSAFSHNTISNCTEEPVGLRNAQIRLDKFDMTSNFTSNPKPYINVQVPQTINENSTLNQTTVPYYFSSDLGYMNADLIINEGVTIYMQSEGYLSTGSGNDNTGRFLFKGTTEKPITFTRIPGQSYNWCYIRFHNAGNQIKDCIFEYGGNDDNGTLNIGGNSCDVAFEGEVTVRNSKTYGIVYYNSANYTGGNNVTFGTGAAANTKGNFYDVWASEPNIHTTMPTTP